MSQASSLYARFQENNPENEFNEELIFWRERDDAAGYLEDIFAALEVVPGITLRGVEIIRDESRFPPELSFNDVDVSRLDLAQVRFLVEMQDNSKEVTLSIFLPKLIDGLFYILNNNTYYPILQLVDRTTYVTKKTFTLKTLLMPIIFRRDVEAVLRDEATGEEHAEMLYVLELFRSKINVLKYFMASKGLRGTIDFFGAGDYVDIYPASVLETIDRAAWRVHAIPGSSGLVVIAARDWIAESPHFRGAFVATLVDALADLQKAVIEGDDPAQWKRRLGRYFTQNSNAFEEKADKILVSLERILDRRTKRNLAHVHAEDKEDIYCILRWMMREYKTLSMVDGMDIRSKRIRVSEYMIHPLLLKFSEGTYRLLNSKNLTFKSLLGIFRPFMSEDDKDRPQVGFLVKKLVTNELLRYVNLVNSFDLLLALRWTARGPQGLADRNRSDVSLKYRGHHPSYVGRISLAAASASDPGTSGTLVPTVKTSGQFFL